jgi:ABC-type maltose transport system permease subunit
MLNEEYFIRFWTWMYNSMLYGKGAMLFTTIFLVFAVWVFIRWRLIGLSCISLLLAHVTAYMGGLLWFWRG